MERCQRRRRRSRGGDRNVHNCRSSRRTVVVSGGGRQGIAARGHVVPCEAVGRGGDGAERRLPSVKGHGGNRAIRVACAGAQCDCGGRGED